MMTPFKSQAQAARIFAMKRSSSSRKRVLSVERDFAEFKTSSDADPVSVAPRFTCMILAAASWVPWATVWTLRAISWVAELCCSTALAIDDAMFDISGDRAADFLDGCHRFLRRV